MAVDIQRGTSVGVSESSGDSADINTIRDQERGSSMPLRYNYDKPEKPRRIKGFEVFSLVFSSFSKPKNRAAK